MQRVLVTWLLISIVFMSVHNHFYIHTIISILNIYFYMSVFSDIDNFNFFQLFELYI